MATTEVLRMNWERLLTILQEDFRKADEALQTATVSLDRAIQLNRSPFPTAGTQERVRLAAREYRHAVEGRATALSRLQSFMNTDGVPQDLQPRGPAKAESARSQPQKRSA